MKNPTINNCKPGLRYLNRKEQLEFAAYLNFHQKIWRPNLRESLGRTFFSTFQINKTDFNKAKFKITRNGAQNLINKLEGIPGVSLTQALEDGKKELMTQPII